jgi:hypothetical protein
VVPPQRAPTGRALVARRLQDKKSPAEAGLKVCHAKSGMRRVHTPPRSIGNQDWMRCLPGPRLMARFFALSVMRTRANSIVCLPASTQSLCAVASPARTRSTILRRLKSHARFASMQPSRGERAVRAHGADYAQCAIRISMAPWTMPSVAFAKRDDSPAMPIRQIFER